MNKNQNQNQNQNKNKSKKKESSSKKEEGINRYQAASIAWSDRVSQSRSQLNNWRICALVSFIVSLLLIISLVFLVSSRSDKVYVAQIGPKDSVQSVRLSTTQLTATEAQKVYFISEFINNIMTIVSYRR